jgi:hypothetical protein
MCAGNEALMSRNPQKFRNECSLEISGTSNSGKCSDGSGLLSAVGLGWI